MSAFGNQQRTVSRGGGTLKTMEDLTSSGFQNIENIAALRFLHVRFQHSLTTWLNTHANGKLQKLARKWHGGWLCTQRPEIITMHYHVILKTFKNKLHL